MCPVSWVPWERAMVAGGSGKICQEQAEEAPWREAAPVHLRVESAGGGGPGEAGEGGYWGKRCQVKGVWLPSKETWGTMEGWSPGEQPGVSSAAHRGRGLQRWWEDVDLMVLH